MVNPSRLIPPLRSGIPGSSSLAAIVAVVVSIPSFVFLLLVFPRLSGVISFVNLAAPDLSGRNPTAAVNYLRLINLIRASVVAAVLFFVTAFVTAVAAIPSIPALIVVDGPWDLTLFVLLALPAFTLLSFAAAAVSTTAFTVFTAIAISLSTVLFTAVPVAVAISAFLSDCRVIGTGY